MAFKGQIKIIFTAAIQKQSASIISNIQKSVDETDVSNRKAELRTGISKCQQRCTVTQIRRRLNKSRPRFISKSRKNTKWLSYKSAVKKYQLVQSRRLQFSKKLPLRSPSPPVDAQTNGLQVCPPCPSSPSSPSSPGTSGRRSVNNTPRHKRPSHINAEYRRRNKIQKGFETLQSLLPSIVDSNASKESKSAMLFKTAEHCRQIKSECRQQQDEASALHKEIENLNADINNFQMQLPATGIPVVEKPSFHSDKMFEDYIRCRTNENWKFWIFSFLVKPLFDSYNRIVSTSTVGDFLKTIQEWTHENLNLVSLRPNALSMLRQISVKSSIITEPHKLPQEAMDLAAKSHKKTS